MTEENEYLSIPGHVPVKVAAKMLGLSEDRVFQHIYSRRLRAKKVGGRYMLDIHEVEDFKRNPPGRVRERAPKWRIYDRRIKLLNTQIVVPIREGQEGLLEEKIQEIYIAQEYRLSGTMGRYILRNIHSPELVTISLLWKDNEMPDEVTRQRELEAFKAQFADVLDWERAVFTHNEGVLYT
jgi:hypothetical protein